MRKLILTVMASLLSCTAAHAFWPEATASSLEIGVGYRQDRLKWKTSAELDYDYSNSYGSGSGESGSGLPLNVQSDLEWKNINIWQIEARGKYVTCDNLYLRGSADYGWITSGKNRDRDFIEVGSGELAGSGYEFASSSSKVKGNVYDVKLAVGYQFQLCDDSFTIAPLVGYSWHGQHFKDSHLRQCFYGEDAETYVSTAARSRSSYYDYYNYSDYSSCSDYSGYSYGGDHSKYHTRWNGPFLGFDFDYRLCCEWDIFGGYEFHWAEFHSKAQWDLRSDLQNGFHQKAKNAYGQVFDIGVKWDLCDCWTLALRGEFQWWCAHHGKDRTKIQQCDFGNVKQKCYLEIPVRKIDWNSASIMFDVGMVF